MKIICAVIASLLTLLIIGFWVFDEAAFRLKTEEAQGVVTEVESRRHHGRRGARYTEYRYTYTYEAEGGTFTGRSVFIRKELAEGDTVTVHYAPGKPDRPSLSSDLREKRVSRICMLVVVMAGVLVLLIKAVGNRGNGLCRRNME